MESLQLSQVLADLSNLRAAHVDNADSIVAVNKPIVLESSTHLQAPPQRPTSALRRAWSSDPSANTPKFDKYGRRILTTNPSPKASAGNSIPGTPKKEELSNLDEDLERASTLMALYDIRSKLKQQDNSSLFKAREKISTLAAKQQAQAQAEKEQKLANEARRNRYSFPKAGL